MLDSTTKTTTTKPVSSPRTDAIQAYRAALAQKVTLATVEPLKTGVTKAFGQPT
jgi:hypothetical protein